MGRTQRMQHRVKLVAWVLKRTPPPHIPYEVRQPLRHGASLPFWCGLPLVAAATGYSGPGAWFSRSLSIFQKSARGGGREQDLERQKAAKLCFLWTRVVDVCPLGYQSRVILSMFGLCAVFS